MAKSKVFKSQWVLLICWLLVFQIAFGYPMVAFATHGTPSETETSEAASLPSSVMTDADRFMQAISQATDSTVPPEATDESFLVTQQFRRDYRRDGTFTETPLLRMNIREEAVSVLNPDRDLKFRYNAAEQSLEIIFMERDSRSGESYASHSHVIRNLKLTGDLSNIDEKLNSDSLRDANFVYLPTESGIRVLIWEQLRSILFLGPIIVPVAVVKPPFEGSTITNVEALHPGQAPRVLTLASGSAQPAVVGGSYRQQALPASQATQYKDGDLSIAVNVTGQPNQINVLIDREEVIGAVRFRMKQYLKAMARFNAPLELVADIEATLKQDEAADIAAANFLQGERDALLNDAGAGNLVGTAFANLAQRTDFQAVLASFEKNSSGHDSYQALANAPRQVRDANPETGAAWDKAFNFITQRRASHASQGSIITWRQALLEQVTGAADPVLKAAENKPANAFAAWKTRVKNSFNRIVTPERAKKFASALALGGAYYLANRVSDGAVHAWTVSTFSRILDWSTHVPVVRLITGPINSSVSYFTDGWSVARWGAGLAIIATIYPLSLIPTKVLAKVKGNSWTTAQAFFTYCTQIAARANYGIRTFVFRNLLNQKLLYETMDANLSVFQNARHAFNVPYIDRLRGLVGLPGDRIQRNADALSDVVHQQAHRKMRAQLLAAALVSELDKVDIATLLMSEEAKKAGILNNFLGDLSTEKLAEWGKITQDVYKALVELNDKGIGDVDANTVQQYFELYTNIGNTIKEARTQAPQGPIAQKASALYVKFSQVMSRNIIPWLLWGKPGYDFYRRYRNAVISVPSAGVAMGQYGPDYESSGFIYGLSDAAKFADVASLGHGAPEVLANQLGQPLIYGFSNGVDVSSSEGASLGLGNPYAPVSDDVFAQGVHGDEGIVTHRTQTIREGFSAIASGVADPNSPDSRRIFKVWPKYMINTLTNFEGRWGLSAPVRIAGLWAADYVASGKLETSAHGLMHFIQEGAAKEAFWWIGKYTITPWLLGYAFVWPIVTVLTFLMMDSVKKNLDDIRTAAFAIESGVDENDPSRMQSGVAALQRLYAKGKVNLPQMYSSAANTFTAMQASQFREHLMTNMPLPTRVSPVIEKWMLNIGFGSIVSTVLFTGLSHTAYDANVSGVALLAKACASFALMLPILKVADVVSHAFWKGVRSVFGGDKPKECGPALGE